jgi:hypothetical protein
LLLEMADPCRGFLLHGSRASLRWPQCFSFRDGSKSLHHSDPSKHRGSAAIGDEYERLERGLPFRERGFFLWKASNVCRRVAQRAQLFAFGEDDRIVEFA